MAAMENQSNKQRATPDPARIVFAYNMSCTRQDFPQGWHDDYPEILQQIPPSFLVVALSVLMTVCPAVISAEEVVPVKLAGGYAVSHVDSPCAVLSYRGLRRQPARRA